MLLIRANCDTVLSRVSIVSSDPISPLRYLNRLSDLCWLVTQNIWTNLPNFCAITVRANVVIQVMHIP
jgi:hypothetical protein